MQIAKAKQKKSKVNTFPTLILSFSCIQEELLLACDEVKSAGEQMQRSANTFASDTSRSDKREVMKESSRDLLMAVVQLMVIADAVDVSKLFNVSNRVRKG